MDRLTKTEISGLALLLNHTDLVTHGGMYGNDVYGRGMNLPLGTVSRHLPPQDLRPGSIS
jgi:hypothetical protein